MGRPLRIVGIAIGLIGNLLIAWAMYHLVQTGNCGGRFEPACSGDTAMQILLLPLGIILSMIGIFAGGGFFSFAAVFVSVGLGAMASSAFPLGKPGPMPLFGWLFGGIFFAAGAGVLVLMLGLGRSTRRRQAIAQNVLAHGRKCIGTVTHVRDTGVTMNDNPHVEITMRAEPIDGGPAMSLVKKVTVPRIAIPRAGERYPVWVDPQHPANWAYATECGPDAPAAVRDLFERARAAQGPGAPADPSPLDEIERLDALRRSGALSEEEFAAAKARLLGRL